MNTDKFTVHGTCTKSNCSGMEIEISRSNDAARFRMWWEGHNDEEPTEWLEINYNDEGLAFCVLPNGNIEFLENYIRYE